MSGERRFFSGATLEQAVLKAARFYGIDPDELAYRRVEKKHGFLRTRRAKVIEVDSDAPRLKPSSARAMESSPAPARGPAAPPPGGPVAAEEEVAAPPPVRAAMEDPPREPAARQVTSPPEASPPVAEAADRPAPRRKRLTPLPAAPRSPADRYPEAAPEVTEAVRESLQRLFEVVGIEMESRILQGEDRLEIELSGPDQERLLEKDGEGLLAFQHLLPRVLRGLTGESTAVRIDCDNFHEIREERLRDLAQREASEVRRRGRPQTLEPMPPDERRIVHLTLTDDPAVETVSLGEGFFKRVVIRPVGRRQDREVENGDSPPGERRPFGRGPR